MKKNNIKKFLYACMGLCAILFSSCSSELASLVEPTKDINGTWQIVKLTRGKEKEDLTSKIDLSKFSINFYPDSTYTLVDEFSFIVNENGTYSFDDPQYPFYLTFKTNSTENKASFEFPVINGQRQIKLTIKPGCSGNEYDYYFAKAQ